MSAIQELPVTKKDIEKLSHKITIQSLIAFVVIGLLAWAAYVYFPQLVTFPATQTASVIFALQLTIIPFLWVLVAVALVATGRRNSVDDARGSAYGPPSKKLAIKAAFLQNTLEQSILLIGAILIASTVMLGDWLSLLFLSVLVFSVGRILFYVGYNMSPFSRALGMIVTLLPALLLYPATLVLLVYTYFL